MLRSRNTLDSGDCAILQIASTCLAHVLRLSRTSPESKPCRTHQAFNGNNALFLPILRIGASFASSKKSRESSQNLSNVGKMDAQTQVRGESIRIGCRSQNARWRK